MVDATTIEIGDFLKFKKKSSMWIKYMEGIKNWNRL